jgi:hypothetical protein
MATISRTSASLLVGLALVCVVAAGFWWTTRSDDSTSSCPLRVEALEPRAQLVDRDSLLPSGTVGEQRREAVEGVSGLGPLGEVVAGRFYERQVDAPALVPYGDRLALVAALEDEPASVTVVDPAADPADATRWSTRVSPGEGARWTSLTGGAVGDEWVSVFSGPDPVLLTLAPEGGRRTCLPLPLDGAGADVVAVTDQAAADVVVLASAVGSGWWLGTVDPVSGEVASSRRVEGPDSWQDVAVAGDLVVGSRWRPSTVGTSGAPRPGDAQAPWIAAWGLDGEDRWTYPAADVRPFPAVLLDQGDDGTSYVVSFDRGGPWLDAVGPDGERRWRSPLRGGEWSGSLWGDVVVVRGPAPAGGPMLRTFDVRDGSERWAVTGRQAPAVGDDPRSGFGSALTEPDAWWVPAPNGLLRIDRRTDAVRRVDSRARIDEMVRIGDHVVVRSGPGVLVTR